MRKKKLQSKQHDITDCGAACLASVSAYYKLQFPISRIRQMAFTNQRGTNVLGMIEAAQKLGFTAKGVKGTLESLHKIPTPTVAHIVVREQLMHFVVIYKVSKKHITIMDPGDGKFHKLKLEEFQKQWTGVLILLVPSEEFEAGTHTTPVYKRFWNLIKPHSSILLQALVGAIIYSILGLSTSIYVQKIVDYVLVDSNIKLLNLLSVIMIIILLIRITIGSVKSIFALKTGQKIDAVLILGYYKHIMKLPQQFFDTMRVGEIISRVNDAVKIRQFINDTSIQLVVNVLITVFTFLLMFIYSWQLALLVLTSIPLFFIIYLIYNKLNKKYLRKVMEKSADLESQLVESVNAMSTIKRFGLEEYSNLKTENRFVSLLHSVFTTGKTGIFTSQAGDFVSGGIIIAMLWIGATKVIERELTPGELMSFYALVGYLLNPIKSLIGMNQSMQNAVIATDRLFQIIDLEREETDKPKIELNADLIGDIVFKDVSFRYGSRNELFKKLNLKIEKGKMTAIVGESGSGKTSLISILQKIYPIQSGSILIGANQINHFTNQSLRKCIGVVPQKVDLFAGSVIENITIGVQEYDMKRVIDICTNIGITSFIEKLPNGFNTYIGENGVSLSGGEKQRIAIARALYKNPDILIFDEATSSLDSVSEQYIKKTIELLKSQGKTIIIIAHRLSTVMNSDHIILLKNGELVEEGNHKSLYNAKNEYYNLWQNQFP